MEEQLVSKYRECCGAHAHINTAMFWPLVKCSARAETATGTQQISAFQNS